MKNISQIILAFCLSSMASCKETKKVSVMVVEENGVPIEGANVHVAYIGYTSKDGPSIKGKSDNLGRFEARGYAPLRIKVMVDKEGYYPSIVKKLSRLKDHDLIVQLRKKKKPIPLNASRYRGRIPKIDVACGFDMAIRDWVAPYGKGKVSDLVFKVTMIKNKDKLGGKLEVFFTNDEEGCFKINAENGFLRTSELTMPNLAPLIGYKNKLIRNEFGYENKKKPKNTSYFFRTRYAKSLGGKASYHYSKFNDGIKFNMGGGKFLEEPYRKIYPDEYGFVEFTYYFNSTPDDRNLEFDPTKNLFKNLDSTEKVIEP